MLESAPHRPRLIAPTATAVREVVAVDGVYRGQITSDPVINGALSGTVVRSTTMAAASEGTLRNSRG